MSNRVVHFASGRGFAGQVTACGRSCHGWVQPRPPEATDNPRLVTCQRCLKELAR